ncbi:MAG: glycosyltransferase family 4 protein [Hyphomicrobiales bacterium]
MELGKVIRSEMRNFSGEQASSLSPMTLELHASASTCANESFDAVRALAKKSSDAVRLPVELLADLRREPRDLRAKFEEKQKALQREIDLFQREQARGGSGLECGLARAAKKIGDITFPGIFSLLPIPQRGVRPLNVCIATEDIVGPVRNGGIGTTYTHLSFLLAKAGHQVTIAYLRGSECADHSIEYWIDWYRERGVKFVPVEPPQDVASPANRWLAPMVALYEYLKGENFDLVHVSEWRLRLLQPSCQATGVGLSGHRVFCVKSSSPYL